MLALMHFHLNLAGTNNPPVPELMDCMLLGPQDSSDRLEKAQGHFQVVFQGLVRLYAGQLTLIMKGMETQGR